MQDEKETQPANNNQYQQQQQQQQQAPAMDNAEPTANTNADPAMGNQIPQPQPNDAANARPGMVQRNLFHFDGSRYISWLPSFSLQVTNGHGVMLPDLLRARQTLSPERLNTMTEQVSQLFAHIPVELIQQDLRQTHSVEVTIENILEDRLIAQNADEPVNRQRDSFNENDSDDTDFEDMEANLRNGLSNLADNLFNANQRTDNNIS